MNRQRLSRVLAIIAREYPYKLTRAQRRGTLRRIGNVVPNGRNRRALDRFVAACVVLPDQLRRP